MEWAILASLYRLDAWSWSERATDASGWLGASDLPDGIAELDTNVSPAGIARWAIADILMDFNPHLMENTLASLNPSQMNAMLDLVADRIIAAEPELSQADRDLGDGDHGLGMKRGMEAAKEALAALPSDAHCSDTLIAFGKAMTSAMGGASGVVFGTLFRAGGKAIKGKEGDFDSAALALMLTAAMEAIMARGGAKPGDKTMLDALVPAKAKAATLQDQPLSATLPEVAQAAEDGRDASKDLIATMGRAKTLGERSLGFPDAGACSVAIILRTMADYCS